MSTYFSERSFKFLRALARDRLALASRELSILRILIQELPVWFDNHVATMDAALASYIQSIGFDTETGEIRNPPKEDCGDGSSACCTPPASAATAESQPA